MEAAIVPGIAFSTKPVAQPLTVVQEVDSLLPPKLGLEPLIPVVTALDTGGDLANELL